MVSSTISIKAALISTGIVVMSLFIKSSVPIAVDFSVSFFPILWSSFLSWLIPPYLFVVTNVIITIIIASSKFYQSIDYRDGEDDDEILHRGCYKSQIEPIVNQAPPRQLELKDVDQDVDLEFMVTISPPILVAEVERSEIVYEEKEEDEISALINGGDEFAVLKSESNKVPSMIESEKLPPAEKPLVSARSGHRKPIKASSKGGNKKKALKVVKPKQHESIENTWKMLTEEAKSTPLTSNFRSSDTFGLGAGGDVKPVLRKAETFRDVTNYRQSSTTVTPPVKKMKKEMSPSREELNRRVEAFIKKCKEERLKSLRFEKKVD